MTFNVYQHQVLGSVNSNTSKRNLQVPAHSKRQNRLEVFCRSYPHLFVFPLVFWDPLFLTRFHHW